MAGRDDMVHLVFYDEADMAFAAIPLSADTAALAVTHIEKCRFEIINGFESRVLH